MLIIGLCTLGYLTAVIIIIINAGYYALDRHLQALIINNGVIIILLSVLMDIHVGYFKIMKV